MKEVIIDGVTYVPKEEDSSYIIMSDIKYENYHDYLQKI